MDTASAVMVRVGRLPGTVTEIALTAGATVAQALQQAGLDASGFQVRVDGVNADLTQPVRDGNTILLTRQIKGNQDVVRVGRLPGTVQSVALEHGSTVADALEEADLDPSGFQVRVNGSNAELGARVSDGDTILLTRQIKGN